MLSDERLSLLGELVLAISEAESADVALELVVSRLCEVTGWPVGQAWVVAEDGGRLRPGSSWYAASDPLSSFREASLELTFAPGVGLPGAAWASREPVWSSDVTTDPRFASTDAARAAGLVAGVAVPVLAGGDVVSVVGVWF